MRNGIGLSLIGAAALSFLQMGANQQALDTAAPRDRFSPRQRKKVVQYARSKVVSVSPEQQIIGKMTNWQRNQWGRAGHPKDMDSLKRFAEMPHWKKARA